MITINDGTYDDDEENRPKPKPKVVKVKPEWLEKPDKEKGKEKEKEEKVPAVRKRSHSTPRKRVISDEHWRKNRSTTQTPSRNLPAPRRINEYTTNRDSGSPRAKSAAKKDVLDKTRPPPKITTYRINDA